MFTVLAAFAGVALAQEPAPVSEAVAVSHRDLEWKVRAVPVYPRAARARGYPDVECRVRLFVDVTGTLSSVDFLNCPPEFQASAQYAAERSAWYPPRVDGVQVPVKFLLIYRFNSGPKSLGPPQRWCVGADRPHESAFHEVDSSALVLRQSPPLESASDACSVAIAIGRNGVPEHVAVPTSGGTRARPVLRAWCDARFEPLDPPANVFVDRPCAP